MVDMDTDELSKIVAQGESETVEFKESFGDRVLEAIGAFSNSQGGRVFLGVKDSGEVCGIQVGKKTLEDIANRIQEATDPRLQPSIKAIQDRKKSVIVIRISAGVGAPVSVHGRYFRRTGRTNQKMSHAEIIRRMKESADSSWDGEIEARSSWSDLDLSKIDQFIETVRKVGRQPIPAQERAQEVLEKLKLTKGGTPTRAAILLFGKDPRHFHFGAYSRVGRFRSPTLIVDDRQIFGTLFDQVDGVMGWFRERLQTEYVITGKPQRDVIWEYPLDAIREGIPSRPPGLLPEAPHRPVLADFPHTVPQMNSPNSLS